MAGLIRAGRLIRTKGARPPWTPLADDPRAALIEQVGPIDGKYEVQVDSTKIDSAPLSGTIRSKYCGSSIRIG